MTGTKSASGDIITDRSKQMERWAEHYQELYTRENTITNAAIGSIDPHPVMEELDVPPSVEELSKAIDSLTCGRAPGSDGIPPEVLKQSLPGCRAEHADRQSSNSDGSPRKQGLGQLQKRKTSTSKKSF
ncbi:hypothetical protein Pmani_003216 [Petrolisthes manimaculis]|uniref:Uncharacterized protein n=1 Tax=Petrolisthes manimaculis TaxID=1843537 RepID=A0AAE1UQ81_9EUCA|nr:hypothetical protein Pmani_003216 [Petrolisthes manimaculis]